MYYVYFLQNKERNFIYVGSTNNIWRRYREHYEGKNLSTKSYRPLELKGYIAVPTRRKANDLEKYFKVGSGKAFLSKRIL